MTLVSPSVDTRTHDVNLVARGFNLPTITALHTCARTDATVDSGLPLSLVHITPQHHLATVAIVGRAGVNASALGHDHAAGLRHPIAALPITAHQNRAATAGARGLNVAVGSQADVLTRKGDASALPLCAVRLNAAACGDRAGGFEHDAPTTFGQAVGRKLTRVDHTGFELLRRFGRQHDPALRCQHRLAVFDQRADGGGRDVDLAQTAALDLQLVTFTGSQCHRAHLREHHTVVTHLRRQ